jgi:hypothetical protein
MPEFQKRGIQGRQGVVIAGVHPLSGFQTQTWAPVSPRVTFNDRSQIGFTGIPNGRIVHLDETGYVEPGLPTNLIFTMPLIVQSNGSGVGTIPQTAVYGKQTPYLSMLPGPNPGLNLVPMCTGYEFMSTEYMLQEEGATYIPGRTALTAIFDLNDPAVAGLIIPLTQPDEICLGIVSAPPGVPRQRFDPVALLHGTPNNERGVSGKNEPGLTFWGWPLPAGILVKVPEEGGSS